MPDYPKPFDLSRLKRTKLKDRPSKVTLDDWARTTGATVMDTMPDMGCAKDLWTVAARIVKAYRAGKPVIIGYGAHLIKLGLSPLIADLIDRGIVTAVITNGAGAIHELEFVWAEKTSENVEENLPAGTFGMAKETAQAYHLAADLAAEAYTGLGMQMGGVLTRRKHQIAKYTVLGAAYAKTIFAGIFVAIGTDIVHMHPECDGGKLGAASHMDFLTLCGLMTQMNGGVYINIGSAVILPEVFLKAVSVAINTGTDLSNMTTANMDFIHHYRPDVNVVKRPPGDGFQLPGCHEIMVPLLSWAILRELA